LTNFTGNAVATLLIGKWTNEIDLDVARATLAGRNPFDELSLEPDAHGAVDAEAASPELFTSAEPSAPSARAEGQKEKVAVSLAPGCFHTTTGAAVLIARMPAPVVFRFLSPRRLYLRSLMP